MDVSELRERDFVVDIESCRTMTEEAGSPDTVSDGENGVNSVSGIKDGGEVSPENVKVLISKEVEGVKAADLAVNKIKNDRRKSSSAKKPPRPPRGLSLDAADQKLIKEIAELAMRKRARIERMKALKKMKAAKASSASSYSSAIFFALFTLLFCIVIAFQGMSCRNCSALSFHGSPETTGSVESLVMVQYQKSMPANDTGYTGSESPTLVEQVSDSDLDKEKKRGTG